MYVYKRQVALFEGIATLLILALALWIVGAHMFTTSAEAANLTTVSDLLTDSGPGFTSVHTISFTAPNTITDSQVITVDFPTNLLTFDLSTLAFADVSITTGGIATGTVSGAAGNATDWGVEIGSDYIQFANCTTAVACDFASTTGTGEIVFTIGVESASMITNPTGPGATTSYRISIGNTPNSASSTITDGGYAMVAIVDKVEVTASVETTFTFTVTGVDAGGYANSATSTFATSTSIALPFGVLTQNVSKTLAQRLNVSTNAINGYVVTVEQDTQLQSSTGADIDGFVNGAWNDTPAAWQAPGNNVVNEDTWGHWGLSSTDGTTTRSGGEFTTDTWVAASTTPTVIMYHDDPADGVTEGIGSSTIGYQVEITALQEAGDDYNTTLTYIATPTF